MDRLMSMRVFQAYLTEQTRIEVSQVVQACEAC